MKPSELSPKQAGSIRDELQLVIASKAFAGTRRCQDFLRLTVEHALAGRLDSLRERMIGAEMFGRPVGYDTSNDAVVRVRATEVRKRLAQYYSEAAQPPAVRIELPSGSYVPRFHWESLEKPAGPPKEAGSLTSAEQAGEKPAPLRAAGEKSWRKLSVLAGTLAALALIAAMGFITWKKLDARLRIRSIAILPLRNLSGDSKQEYFAEGMTEELIAALGQVSALRVISRTSTMTYKGTKKALPEIARELAVDGVVEGSVAREGNQVRITAQLIDARTDRHIWARSYTRSLTSVLALQGEVARAIADAIRIQVTPQEQTRLARARPVNADAQELYLLGKYSMNQGDPRNATVYFQKALAIDPDYAQAHAGLADSFGGMGGAGFMAYSEAFTNERTEAASAIAIDDALPEGHVELARAAANLDWDWATQEKELKRALELNPNDASTHMAYADRFEKSGRIPEALAEMKLALDLDPVSTRSLSNAGYIYYYARQYDQVLALLKRVYALTPDSAGVFLHWGFIPGVTYTEKGMYEEAIRNFQKLGDKPHALGHMGNAYARAGRVAEARAIIPRLEQDVRKDGVGWYETALVYAGLGEKDEAFAWLEKAYGAHDKGLTYIRIDPCLDPLRSDPRFANLERRVGLPP
ncbi:MAG TPA: tetratricopeptide repeat protein [Candidatus Acidoferrales bacterium]|nr:tetratricopeptide repeat protein [Candidatus Acidoferrales bacterium]